MPSQPDRPDRPDRPDHPDIVPPAEPAAAPAAEPRQRWRLVVARAPAAPPQTQRELSDAWETAIIDAGLPVARGSDPRARPRISFGAPLPVAVAADAELVDIVLTERWPVWRVREALTPRIPVGWRIVDLEDVWLAGPPLAGQVAAADYRIVLAGTPDPEALAGACRAVLAAERIERDRAKGGGTVQYDLRPLLIDVGLAEPGPPPIVVARTRFHPELGTGRPEEVVGALADASGLPLEVAAIVRERLLLADEIA